MLSWLKVDAMLTPGNTPLPRTVDIDPPLLGHRYMPISVAGDGAFSYTILAYDTLHPTEPIIAIKAMKPSFEIIGQRVTNLMVKLIEGIQPPTKNWKPSNAQTYVYPYCPSQCFIFCVIYIPSCSRSSGPETVVFT
jgi:hypothetical protein